MLQRNNSLAASGTHALGFLVIIASKFHILIRRWKHHVEPFGTVESAVSLLTN
jgi:hypothetical protein